MEEYEQWEKIFESRNFTYDHKGQKAKYVAKK